MHKTFIYLFFFIFRDMADDLFAGMIQEMFQAADADGKGHVNKEEFTQVYKPYIFQVHT